jgi:hypothetical protein
MSADQLVSTSLPSGETMPRPVTTTLRLPFSELTCTSCRVVTCRGRRRRAAPRL